MRRLLCLLLLAAWSAGAAAGGIAVAVGGALRDDNDAVWGRIVELAGGRGAHFVVLATASAQPEASGAAAVANLQRHGAVAQALPVAPLLRGVDLGAAVRDPRWIGLVDHASGVFFTGGAQARLVDTLNPGGRPTPLLQALRALFARGGVVAGTSAGTAVLSATMFRDAPDLLGALERPLRNGIEFGPGLGFLPPEVVVDQHFLRRGRIGRLLPLLVERDLPLGIGVDEDTAAIFQGSVIEAIGSSGVLVVDLRDAQHDAARGAFNVRGVRLHLLSAGDRYDLARHVLLSARPAHPADDEPAGPDFFADILGEETLPAAIRSLAGGAPHEVVGLSFDPRARAGGAHPDLGFEWRLTRPAPGTDGDGAVLEVRPVHFARPLYRPWRP